MTEKKSVDELIELMFAVSRQIKEQVKHQNCAGPLSAAHVGIMRFIIERGAPTMKEIADHFSVSAPSATSFIETLIKSGYLERVTDSNDRRIIRVSITGKGSEAMDNLIGSVKKRMAEALEVLDDEQQENLHRALETLIKSFKH